MSWVRKTFVAMFAVAVSSVGFLLFPSVVRGDSYGMGGGMMGGGMMGQPGYAEPYVPVNPARADALLRYVHEQNLPCLQCHAVSGPGVGPAFASVAARYADRPHAAEVLRTHIAHGFGRMPPEMASDTQASRLATLILSLDQR